MYVPVCDLQGILLNIGLKTLHLGLKYSGVSNGSLLVSRKKFTKQKAPIELIALSGTNDKQAVSKGVEKHFTPA